MHTFTNRQRYAKQYLESSKHLKTLLVMYLYYIQLNTSPCNRAVPINSRKKMFKATFRPNLAACEKQQPSYSIEWRQCVRVQQSTVAAIQQEFELDSAFVKVQPNVTSHWPITSAHSWWITL